MRAQRNLNTLYFRRATKKGRSGKNLIWLRNRILEAFKTWEPTLEAHVASGDHFFGMGQKRKNIGLHLLIFGVARDGRAILLYPIRAHNKSGGFLPKAVREFMMEYEHRNALVGTCVEIGDAFDIVVDNAAEYPRKKRTYTHLKVAKNEDSEE
jgi:hypothetical protein